jgi:hypothetical protein
MLYCRKPVVAGMPSPRCVPPLVDIATSTALCEFPPSIIFRITAQIPNTAGGPYGDEVRPD